MRVKRQAHSVEGLEPFVVPPGQEPLFPPLPPSLPAVRRRRWPYAIGGAILFTGFAAAILVWVLLFRGPDLRQYDDGLAEAINVAGSIQIATDALSAPKDLQQFRSFLITYGDDLRTAEVDAASIGETRHRQALLRVVTAEQGYVTELRRLSQLAPREVANVQFARSSELAREAEEAILAAPSLPSGGEVRAIDLSPAALTRVLSALRATWVEIQADRRRINRLNANRVASLRAVRSFSAQFDGIVARYSEAREELGDWIYKVNSVGASFIEAYQVLELQAERRRQFRSELAALSSPPEFSPDKAALLAVMDSAIAATETASRGIAEYQSDYSGYYSSYDQTPGWQEFEVTSDAVGTSYANALRAYKQRKDLVEAGLSKRVRLPKLPTNP